MSNNKFKTLSPLGQSALSLDQAFTDLATLSGQIERLEIESDSGMQKAPELLAQFGECSQKIAEGIQGFATILQQTRTQSEKSVQLVSEKAVLIQKRHEENVKMKQVHGIEIKLT